MATDAGIRKYRQNRYPPPGMLERCRKKILELCQIDISEALVKTKSGKISLDIRKIGNDSQSASHPLLNLTECLEKQFHLSGPLPRRPSKETALPSHVRQERPPHLGPPVPHPALKERGNPFPPRIPEKHVSKPIKSGPLGALRPSMGGKTGPSSKGGGAMGFVMPIYTVGIVVFFIYTISKVLFRKPDDRTPKVMDFHMDPEYRKYVLSEEYQNGTPLSYKDYLKKKEKEEYDRSAAKLLGNQGRKQVFTAIEGIIAEMDDFRERLMAEQNKKSIEQEDEILELTSEEESRTISEIDGDAAEEAIEISHEPGETDSSPAVAAETIQEEEPPMELSVKLAKLAVVGIETQADFQGRKEPIDEEPEATEVSNIVLERSVPSDAQLLVAESQCLTHTTTEPIDGWSESDEQPVIVTGKMTISLLGKDASVHSTESKASKETSEHDKELKEEQEKVQRQRKQIEELANALVEDILHNQLPKVLEKAASKGSSDVDTFEILTPSSEARNHVGQPKNLGNQRRQMSRESLNSQGSSFEYVSACQDEVVERPRASLSPIGSDLGEGDHITFDFLQNGNYDQHNGGSPASFECILSGSVSPVSPETEATFEKVHLSNNGQHQPDSDKSKDVGESQILEETNEPRDTSLFDEILEVAKSGHIEEITDSHSTKCTEELQRPTEPCDDHEQL